MLFITEPFLQTHEAPHGPIILVFSSANYATLPWFICVAKARVATDCALSASTPQFAVLTLTGRHVGPIALQHPHDLSSPEGICPHLPEKTNKYDRKKGWFCQGNMKAECAALMKSAMRTQKAFHSDLQNGRMIPCSESTNSSKFQTGVYADWMASASSCLHKTSFHLDWWVLSEGMCSIILESAWNLSSTSASQWALPPTRCLFNWKCIFKESTSRKSLSKHVFAFTCIQIPLKMWKRTKYFDVQTSQGDLKINVHNLKVEMEVVTVWNVDVKQKPGTEANHKSTKYVGVQ